MTGGTKRTESRTTQAGNWTSGERRGKFAPVKIDGSAKLPFSRGGIQFTMNLRRTVERPDEDEDAEQVLRIEFSLETARALHNALEHAFMDLMRCPTRRNGHHCGDFKGGKYRDCDVCEEWQAERDAMWECLKRWDAGQPVDAPEPGCTCLVAMHPRPGQRHDEQCAGYPKQFYQARQAITVEGRPS